MLSQYDLVNTKGLRGLDYQGRFIPFDKIDDKLADELVGKTHVLKRKEGQQTAATAVATTESAAEEAPESAAPARRTRG